MADGAYPAGHGCQSEGTIEVKDGYRVWYRRVGGGQATPLLILHGGPGAGHDYLETLEALADERPVIFYDQLGCGRTTSPTTRPAGTSRGRPRNRYMRHALGLDRIHLLGQSWGGWLAIEYMLGQPAGIEGLILASTSASIPQFVAECERLKSELPPDVFATLQKYEAAHDYRHPAYEKPPRSSTNDTSAGSGLGPIRMCKRSGTWRHQVYETMNGPNEFMVIGNLRTWDRIGRLAEIQARTLITVGKYDELSPTCAETLRQGIAGSAW